MNKLWDMQTVEYSSALKRKEFSGYEKKRRKLNAYQVKEANLRKATQHMIPTM